MNVKNKRVHEQYDGEKVRKKDSCHQVQQVNAHNHPGNSSAKLLFDYSFKASLKQEKLLKLSIFTLNLFLNQHQRIIDINELMSIFLYKYFLKNIYKILPIGRCIQSTYYHLKYSAKGL